MNGDRKPQTSGPASAELPRTTVRIGIVQLDYQPSAILSYPMIEEPALLAEGERGITALRLLVPELQDSINRVRREVSDAYDAFLGDRISLVLRALDHHEVDVVVFPEYSIPHTCLPLIQQGAGACTVVAGSHTVTASSLEVCQKLGIAVSEDDIGKSICPIRLGNGKWEKIDKLTRSRWEPSLKLGNGWHVINAPTRNGSQVSFAVFLCVDFINEQDENLQRYVDRNVWKQIHFAVVPSYSPSLRDFEQRARAVAERAGCPVAYVNVGSLGGSRLYCHFEEVTSLTDRAGTVPLAAGDETAVAIDLEVGGYRQFSHIPTPLPTPSPPSKLFAFLPILGQTNYPRLWEIHDQIRRAADDTQRRARATEAKQEFLRLTSEPQVSSALKAKLFMLLEGMNWRDGKWLSSCLDCIMIPGEISNLDEQRFVLLYRAQATLAELVKDPRTRGADLETVSATLAVFRRAMDTLRPRISPKIVAKFETRDFTVQTVGGDPKSPEFTSVFVMRVKSAQPHRSALERQMRLISTLAYEGNRHLSLNIRYSSLPNPGGNLKHLNIDILGAVRSEDRLNSRELADAFRRELASLLRVTLHNVYAFQLQELDPEELARITSPFPFNHIAEIRRRVDFGKPPYLDSSTAPSIHHLEGSSTLARLLDSLQSNPFACLISMHLNPTSLTEAERSFYSTYLRTVQVHARRGEGAMFWLGTERYPALRLGDVLALEKMLDTATPHGFPSLVGRLFVASDQPVSGLLLNAIGNELWGNDSYQIALYNPGNEDHDRASESLRSGWPTAYPAYPNAPPELGRVPFLFDPYEASRLFRIPLEGQSGAVGKLSYTISAPAAVLPEDGIEIGFGSHPGVRHPLVVRLADEERTKHTYVVGKTGTGKSTLLRRMIEQDILRGSGVCVIDPHGDLVDAVLARLPRDRVDDVVLLNPAQTDRPFGLNLLEYNPTIPQHKDFVVQETISIMRKLFYFEHGGPIFEHNLRHLVLTMLDDSIGGQGTLIEVPRLLYDKSFREAVTARLKDALARDFWEQYKSMSDYHKSEHLWYIVSKFDTFTIDRIMRNIIGQAKSSVNISDLMERRQILLIKLSSAMIGDLNAALLGMIVLSKIRWAGMARASLPPGQRADYYVYVDEFQNFAASGFETILAEARKYGISLTLAHQHLGQLSAFNISTGKIEDRALQAIFGNAGTMIAFRVGVRDAETLAKEFGPPVDPPDLEDLPNFKAIVKTLISGEVYPPFTIGTSLGTAAEDSELASAIAQLSHLKYGCPVADIEAEIGSRRNRLAGSAHA